MVLNRLLTALTARYLGSVEELDASELSKERRLESVEKIEKKEERKENRRRKKELGSLLGPVEAEDLHMLSDREFLKAEWGSSDFQQEATDKFSEVRKFAGAWTDVGGTPGTLKWSDIVFEAGVDDPMALRILERRNPVIELNPCCDSSICGDNFLTEIFFTKARKESFYFPANGTPRYIETSLGPLTGSATVSNGAIRLRLVGGDGRTHIHDIEFMNDPEYIIYRYTINDGRRDMIMERVYQRSAVPSRGDIIEGFEWERCAGAVARNADKAIREEDADEVEDSREGGLFRRFRHRE